jgi:hypothetical protein
MSSASRITLFFGRRAYDAETARIAADALRARGFAITEQHVAAGEYSVATNAPRAIALEAKRRARAIRGALKEHNEVIT